MMLSGAAAARTPQPSKFGSPAPLSVHRASVAGALRSTDTVVSAAWQSMLAEYPLTANTEGPVDPFYVPNIYVDRDGFSAVVLKIRYDGIRALNYAIRYALTGDEAAAEAAVRQITPWATVQAFNTAAGSDTRLTWTYTFPFFISAAMLIRSSNAYTPALAANMADMILRSRPICSTAYTATNNHADWGVVFEMASASFLEDRAAFDAAVLRWKALLESSTDENNILLEEVHRQGGGQGNGTSGLFYSNFAMTAKTFGAEWARMNGVWLYEHVTSKGSSLRGIWEKVAGWTRNPETFTYNTSGTTSTVTDLSGSYEILNTLWPAAAATSLLAQYRPTIDRYGMRYFTVTHARQPLRG